MQKTVFTTPVVNHLFRAVARLFLRVSGWRVVGELPADTPKYVLIGAPHTSNWDFPLMLVAVLHKQLDVRWMGKDALFRGPMGPVMRWLGGIAIDRSQANGLVGQMVDVYRQSESMIVTIPPEGTRKKVERWKTGFYWIAHEAGVPIVLGFADFGKKEVGFGPVFHTSGDIDRDMPLIQAFYKDKQGRHPELF
ncbi:MAG: glycerol acyltransferase [Gammaproteobacteria bacterium]|nr:MAG: glycerol acyltransferase [Gammaproteobacteria bacterium]